MSYTINNYNGTLLTTIPDGQLDTTTSLSLAGRNFQGYGQYLNENQVYLLQNFANVTAPTNSITGQLWYNPATGTLSTYTSAGSYAALTNLSQLTANVVNLNSSIASNVNTINASIAANVAALYANAAVQDTSIQSLWANAAVQDTSIQSLWANAAVQDTHLNTIDTNVAAANAAIALRANIASPAFTGNPTAPTPAAGNRDTSVATTAYVMVQDDVRRIYTDNNISANILALNVSINSSIALKAPLASPALTGTPTAPTANLGDNTTTLATTAYVMAQDAQRALMTSANIASNVTALTNYVNNAVAPLAPIISPAFQGTPTAPTPSPGDNSTTLATTAFVNYAVSTNALWQGSHRFISASGPDNTVGIDGDFWFQYQ